MFEHQYQLKQCTLKSVIGHRRELKCIDRILKSIIELMLIGNVSVNVTHEDTYMSQLIR